MSLTRLLPLVSFFPPDTPRFADNWNWYDGVDPTNGFVDYLSAADAYKAGIAYVASNGNAVMKVETTPVVDAAVGRKSTRIGTNWR